MEMLSWGRRTAQREQEEVWLRPAEGTGRGQGSAGFAARAGVTSRASSLPLSFCLEIAFS